MGMEADVVVIGSGAGGLTAAHAGVRLIANARATRLRIDKGAVIGLVAKIDGVEQAIGARRGVVLAWGGFGANPELRRKYVAQADAGHSLQPERNSDCVSPVPRCAQCDSGPCEGGSYE